MTRPVLIGKAEVTDSNTVLKLYQGKDDCTISIEGRGELMSTRRHASEDALGTLSCGMLQESETASVLIGGLGMGFTLAAVLASTGAKSQVTVAELVPEVVEWNKGPLGSYAGYPLNDKRTIVYKGDVSDLLRSGASQFDVIALDVDNGPEALSATGNDWLYTLQGVRSAIKCLKRNGVIAYWSATRDERFVSKLKQCGLQVTEKPVFAHGKKGTKHFIWLATV